MQKDADISDPYPLFEADTYMKIFYPDKYRYESNIDFENVADVDIKNTDVVLKSIYRYRYLHIEIFFGYGFEFLERYDCHGR